VLPKRFTSKRESANVFEEFPRAIVMLEAFFFRAEFGRMRLKSACGCPQGMFHVEHLVIEDQLDA